MFKFSSWAEVDILQFTYIGTYQQASSTQKFCWKSYRLQLEHLVHGQQKQ